MEHRREMTNFVRLLLLLAKILLYPFIKCLSLLLSKIRRRSQQDYSCNIVLVTGAAQGIGKALAIEVCFLFLIDC